MSEGRPHGAVAPPWQAREDQEAAAMAGRLLGRQRTKDPAQLVQRAHQAFLRLPFESDPERVADDIAKLLHSMKVEGDGMIGSRRAEAFPGPARYLGDPQQCLGVHPPGGGPLGSSRRASAASPAHPLPPAGPSLPPLPAAAPQPLLCPPRLPAPQEAMFGEEEAGAAHSNKEAALIIAYEAVSCGLLTDFVTYLGMLEFESRKDLVAIFGALVRIEHNGDFPGLRFLLDNDAVLVTLFDGWV